MTSAGLRTLTATVGTRALVVDLRPTRGLDIGRVEFDGLRLDWSRPDDESVEPDPWLSAFQGGCLVTCGLHNVGVASDGHGLHGNYTFCAAREVDEEEGLDATEARVVRGKVLDGDLHCTREVSVTAAPARIAVTDEVTNTSSGELQAPMLYHLNWGRPFLGPDLTVEAPLGPKVTTRGAGTEYSWARPFQSDPNTEHVVEHVIPPSVPHVVRLTNNALGVRVRISWTGLHRLHQWIDLRPHRGVVAIEPANCSIEGRAYDRRMGQAPFLKPGETRRTSVTLDFEAVP